MKLLRRVKNTAFMSRMALAATLLVAGSLPASEVGSYMEDDFHPAIEVAEKPEVQTELSADTRDLEDLECHREVNLKFLYRLKNSIRSEIDRLSEEKKAPQNIETWWAQDLDRQVTTLENLQKLVNVNAELLKNLYPESLYDMPRYKTQGQLAHFHHINESGENIFALPPVDLLILDYWGKTLDQSQKMALIRKFLKKAQSAFQKARCKVSIPTPKDSATLVAKDCVVSNQIEVPPPPANSPCITDHPVLAMIVAESKSAIQADPELHVQFTQNLSQCKGQLAISEFLKHYINNPQKPAFNSQICQEARNHTKQALEKIGPLYQSVQNNQFPECARRTVSKGTLRKESMGTDPDVLYVPLRRTKLETPGDPCNTSFFNFKRASDGRPNPPKQQRLNKPDGVGCSIGEAQTRRPLKEAAAKPIDLHDQDLERDLFIFPYLDCYRKPGASDLPNVLVGQGKLRQTRALKDFQKREQRIASYLQSPKRGLVTKAGFNSGWFKSPQSKIPMAERFFGSPKYQGEQEKSCYAHAFSSAVGEKRGDGKAVEVSPQKFYDQLKSLYFTAPTGGVREDETLIRLLPAMDFEPVQKTDAPPLKIKEFFLDHVANGAYDDGELRRLAQGPGFIAHLASDFAQSIGNQTILEDRDL